MFSLSKPEKPVTEYCPNNDVHLLKLHRSTDIINKREGEWYYADKR